jgi:hypothetical protein
VIPRLLGAIVIASLWLVAAQPALAHEERAAGRYTLLVGLIGEPFLQGPRSGFEFWVTEAGRRVGGADRTLRAEVIRDGTTRSLAIVEREDAGHYEAEFSAPDEGAYALRIVGSVEGQAIDESFQFRLAPPDDAGTTGGSLVAPSSASDPGFLPLAAAGLVLILAVAGGLIFAARRAAPA